MIVMKFGGMSIADAPSVLRVIEIIRSFIQEKPVVVYSAMGKTTRNLLNIAQLSKTGRSAEAGEKLQEIIDFHHGLGGLVLRDYPSSPVHGLLEHYFREIRSLFEGVCVLRDLTDRSLDAFLAYGERISTAIMARALSDQGMPATLMDARSFMITDDRFGQARPLEEIAFPKIREQILPVIERGFVPVIQGYIGATQHGATTTFGFEGSDLTATFIGSALEARDVKIWKDVPGIMSADPAVVPEARTVSHISFEEASELTFFGAQVLHPRTLEPARAWGVPVHVLHSQRPDAPGTEIQERPGDGKSAVRSVTSRKGLMLLGMKTLRSRPNHESIRRFLEILDRERIVPYLFSASESYLAAAIPGLELAEHVLNDFQRIGDLSLVPSMATVTLVGQSLAGLPGFLSRVLDAAGEREVRLVAHRSSPNSLTLLVEESCADDLVRRFHHRFISH
ncbi:aspartate kinase [bacterium]|nr:aspartate kinase [bacterium]